MSVWSLKSTVRNTSFWSGVASRSRFGSLYERDGRVLRGITGIANITFACESEEGASNQIRGEIASKFELRNCLIVNRAAMS